MFLGFEHPGAAASLETKAPERSRLIPRGSFSIKPGQSSLIPLSRRQTEAQSAQTNVRSLLSSIAC